MLDRAYATSIAGEVSRGNPQKSTETPKQKPQAKTPSKNTSPAARHTEVLIEKLRKSYYTLV